MQQPRRLHKRALGHQTKCDGIKGARHFCVNHEFEAVGASLKVPWYKTFFRVTLPICSPALVDIARYFFVNAMTTISAVVFLYSPETKGASIAILNMDEAGEISPAVAMAVLIAATCAVGTLLFSALGWWVDRRAQAWRTSSR